MEPLNIIKSHQLSPPAPPTPLPALSPACHSPQRPAAELCPAAPAGRGQVWPGLALVLRKWLTAGLTPAMCSGRLCLSPGAAPGARGQPALQAKQRKVRVSGGELCPRLRKHILAEERNTMQAGRETQLPSNPLQGAFGSLQLPESLLSAVGLFIVTGFCVFVFWLLHQRCREERTEQRGPAGRALLWETGNTASLS